MKRILVVDNEIAILTVVKLILAQYNYQVETVARWEELQDAIKNFKPDLILLDVSLSGVDGRDICNKLKNEQDTAHIPVILFSADAIALKSLKDCKPDAVIAKPFDSSELVNVIQAHLN